MHHYGELFVEPNVDNTKLLEREFSIPGKNKTTNSRFTAQCTVYIHKSMNEFKSFFYLEHEQYYK